MSRPSAKTPAPPADGQVCALFAVDIAGFTGPHRDDDIRLYLHEELYQVLHKAFDGSGIPWAHCFCEDRGDGAAALVEGRLEIDCSTRRNRNCSLPGFKPGFTNHNCVVARG